MQCDAVRCGRKLCQADSGALSGAVREKGNVSPAELVCPCVFLASEMLDFKLHAVQMSPIKWLQGVRRCQAAQRC